MENPSLVYEKFLTRIKRGWLFFSKIIFTNA